jgi:hypothetical protein
MTEPLEKVIDAAKKLRKLAKKIDNSDVQGLIVELNLSLADLKMQLAEMRAEDAREPQSAPVASAPQASSQPSGSSSGSCSLAPRDSAPTQRWS